MIRSQGKYFSESELKRIVMLLRESDMTLPEIADRMRCSRSAVAAVNRRFQVRLYEGRRSQWNLSCVPAMQEKPVDVISVMLPSDEMVRNES
jgi:transcriptional regulator